MVAFILIIPIALIVGYALGYWAVNKYGEKLLNMAIQKRALKVISGDLKNEYELDGKKQAVNVFICRDEKNVETVIKLTDMEK